MSSDELADREQRTIAKCPDCGSNDFEIGLSWCIGDEDPILQSVSCSGCGWSGKEPNFPHYLPDIENEEVQC